jgi:hypothetical protein
MNLSLADSIQEVLDVVSFAVGQVRVQGQPFLEILS